MFPYPFNTWKMKISDKARCIGGPLLIWKMWKTQ